MTKAKLIYYDSILHSELLKSTVSRLALPHKSLAKVNMSHAKQEECSSTFDSVIELGVENSVNKLEE